jgi:protein TonB
VSALTFEPRALPAPYPVVTPGDRLALTLCLAIIVHAMIILGVSFAPEPPARLRPEGLEVTLVAQKAPAPPEDPDVLAQANAEGGGETVAAARPSSPVVAPVPAPDAEIAAAAPPASPPAEELPPPFEPRPPARVPQASTQDALHEAPAPAKLVKPAPVAKLRDAPAQRREAPKETEPAPAASEDQAAPAAVEAPALPSAQQLITRSFAMASLHAELQQKLETKASRPRTKYVSASTQEYKYAAYMEAWRQKVERIGNLNYPDEARRRKLSGALLLDVSLKPDGTVLEIIVRRSSGHRVLDDAAVRIVELAGPFAPFPEEIRREVDVLHVTRTWKFLSSETFRAQ